MLTLWDLMKPVMQALRPRPRRQRQARRRPVSPAAQRTDAGAATVRQKPGAQDAYDRVVRDMLERHRVRVRRWRSSMSGMAWEVRYADGSVARLIEAPRPKGPMSAAVFLHEIGHHAIGFNTYKPRCLEEYHAWRWSLEAMEANGLNVTDAVRRRMHESLWYAISKASRRGIRSLPAELEPYRTRPPRRRRGRKTGDGEG